MAIIPGDKLKTLEEFKENILWELGNIMPGIPIPPPPGSNTESIVNAMAEMMHNQQNDYWSLMHQSLPRGGQGYPPYGQNPAFDPSADPYGQSQNETTTYFETHTGCSHSWKLYDSGFSKFEYCTKCNQEKR